jgi:hypothetical protein
MSQSTEANGETKANVFISYSRKDIAFVDRLAMALEALGTGHWALGTGHWASRLVTNKSGVVRK